MKRAALSATTSLAVFGLVLVACSPSPKTASSDAAVGSPAPAAAAPTRAVTAPDEDSCNKAAYASLVGTTEKDPMVPPASALVRHIHPGDQVTMDYRADRLDIDIDDKGVITGLRCG